MSKPKPRPAVVEDATGHRPQRHRQRGVPDKADARLETYERATRRQNEDPRTRETSPDSLPPNTDDARLND